MRGRRRLPVHVSVGSFQEWGESYAFAGRRRLERTGYLFTQFNQIMEKFKTIQKDIEQLTHHEVIRKTQVSRPAVLMLGIAVVAAAGGMAYKDPNAAMPTFLFTIAAFLFLAGIVKLCVGRKCYFFRPTGSRMEELTLYFDVKARTDLQNCIEMKRFDELKKLKREKDSGIKVEALVAGDRQFAAIQISEYVPYTYEAVTPVVCYYGEEARRFASGIKP